MEQPIVQMLNVTKRIGKRTIIDHLSLDLPAGEVFGFLGPNGAGKTTMIRMMVGLISITGGEIKIDGHSISKQFEKAIRHVGAIVENPEMYKYMTGYQNLVHFARMVPGVEHSRIQEVTELVGLGSRINDKVNTYSLGMRQRLGVAQAILHRPKLLILDEPTNGLDPMGIRELRDYLQRLAKQEGLAIFVSSHLLAEMELMCDRVAIIQQGKLVEVVKVEKNRESERTATQRVVFEVDDLEAALAVAATEGIAGGRAGRAIAIGADKEAVAIFNAKLVAAGIKVYGIQAQHQSLEDRFLEKTGGGHIV
ncbi:ABC-2 type transport system ATP-binding protein [Paenibacillus algorifonticola]|uniref:ABC-2 type transport system ATP-binding protein n=2 Tax=Paenibacillus algorifonticola TaxID=684063 RepID=A0A1I2E0T8_9BACL|nr:ABC-2 type transport system ATP-binding protein [Paenibacillus algorifonticola]